MTIKTIKHGRTRLSLVWLLAGGAIITACSAVSAENPDALYQYSTLPALAAGIYEGEVTCGQLLQQGDFGIGTFQYLDGEMIVLDGKCSRVKSDGSVQSAAPETKSPFAVITTFHPQQTIAVNTAVDWPALQETIKRQLPSLNMPYAVKVTGTFEWVKTRSVPPQSPPYPRLAEVVKSQPTYEYRQQAGTLVGFWLPEYLNGVNLPGFHLHFLADQNQGGGHLLALQANTLRVWLDPTPVVKLVLPQSGEFLTKRLTTHENMDTIEKTIGKSESEDPVGRKVPEQ